MSNPETYVTKNSPSVDDWIEYNKGPFDALRAGTSREENVTYAQLTDFDGHASRAGIETQEYFEQLKSRVGHLGGAALQLVYSEMDDAWHVIVG